MISNDANKTLIRNIRIILIAVLSTSIFTPQIYQPLLDKTWSWLYNSSVFQLSTFETFWTVTCYAIIEPWMTTIFIKHPELRFANNSIKKQRYEDGNSIQYKPKPHGMRRPSRRILEMITYITPLLILDLTMIKKFAGVPVQAMLVSGNYHVPFSHPYETNGTEYCIGSTCHRSYFLIPTLHNFTLSSPLQTHRALPVQAPSSRRLTLELITSLLIYDFTFFLFHLALHITPGLKTWHAAHHKHKEIHPQITNQLHLVERLGLVLLANFSLNVIRSHVLTRTVFVPVFVWLLVEIHAGLDLPWGLDKVLPRGWAGGARKHAGHHADGRGGLEPYFGWCDKLLDMVCGKREKSKIG